MVMQIIHPISMRERQSFWVAGASSEQLIVVQGFGLRDRKDGKHKVNGKAAINRWWQSRWTGRGPNKRYVECIGLPYETGRDGVEQTFSEGRQTEGCWSHQKSAIREANTTFVQSKARTLAYM